MYAQHFGLKHEPFSIAPDPRYLFMSEQHREALAHLLYGVNGGGGFVLLTGEVGAGKTTVCRCFLEQIPKRCNVAYIFNPKLTVAELLKAVCEEFRIPVDVPANATPTVKDYIDPLNEFLLKTHAVGQNSVLIIDEAQNLSSDVLEQLRLLTNLETSERKLLQIILIGQPELRDLLARPELEQLAQRVIARFHLEALTEPESLRYIRHRLSVAGQSSTRPFERKAMQRIFRLARGIPRRINLLADRALLGAYATGTARVNVEIVDKAALEVFGRAELNRISLERYPHWMVLAGGVAAGSIVVGGLALWLGMHVGAGARDSASTVASASAGAGGGAGAGAGVAVPALAGASASGTTAIVTPTATATTPTGAPATALAITPAITPTNAPATAPPPVAASSAATSATALAPSPASPGNRPAAATAQASAPAAGVPPAGAMATAAATAATTAPLSPLRDQRQAWQELARLWGLPPGLDDPCRAASNLQVECFRGTTSLALLRVLDRPAILTLQDASDRPVYAVLTGLTDKSATLRMGASGAVSQTLSLVTLGRMWHGEFATMWRAPPGYPGMLALGASGPAVQHLATQLATVQGTPPPTGPLAFDANVKSQVNAFQQSHGLKPDGVAGPTTFMLLNRATGVDEPRLATGA